MKYFVIILEEILFKDCPYDIFLNSRFSLVHVQRRTLKRFSSYFHAHNFMDTVHSASYVIIPP